MDNNNILTYYDVKNINISIVTYSMRMIQVQKKSTHNVTSSTIFKLYSMNIKKS